LRPKLVQQDNIKVDLKEIGFGRPKYRWQDVKEIGFEDVDWIYLAFDGVQLWALVNTLMNLQVL
jgi:hypothetical protein